MEGGGNWGRREWVTAQGWGARVVEGEAVGQAERKRRVLGSSFR